MSDADEGLFGPGSVTWRVHADPTMLVAGVRALILQSLHPVALAGVRQNSSFRSEPWSRLRNTAEHVGLTTFGSTSEAEAAGARVRRIHSFLSGEYEGRPFRVDDPDLLTWVHVVEVESFLSVVRSAGLSLSDEEADRYLQEQRQSARLIGLDPDLVPASLAEVREYYAETLPLLRVDRDTLDTLRFLVAPPMPRPVSLTPARLLWADLVLLATGLLPEFALDLLPLPTLPGSRSAALLATRALRRSLLLIPEARREGPHVKAMRARLDLPLGWARL